MEFMSRICTVANSAEGTKAVACLPNGFNRILQPTDRVIRGAFNAADRNGQSHRAIALDHLATSGVKKPTPIDGVQGALYRQ
jgi:hypothetical protein